MSEGGTTTAVITSRRGADAFAVSLMFVFITGAVTLSLMPVVTNDLQTRFGLSSAAIGLLTSVFMGFYGVAGITSGVFAARWGGRLLAASCGCFVVGSVLFGASSSFAGFLLGRCIQGVGGGMVVAVCSPVIARVVRAEWQSRVWGIFGAGWGIGSMAALLVLPSIEKAGGYRGVSFAIAGLALVVGVVALSQKAIRVLPEQTEEVATLRGLARSLRSVVTNYRVLLAGFANTADLVIAVGVLAFAPKFLQDVHGATVATSLYLVAGLGAAQTIGNPLGAAAAAKWGKYWMLIASLIGMMIATVLEGLSSGIVIGFVLVLAAGFFSMFLFPPMLGSMPDIVKKPEQVGPATGINSFMGFAGSMVAPWLFGHILDVSKPPGHSEAPPTPGAYLGGFAMLAAFGLAALIGMSFFRPGKVEAWRRMAKRDS